MFDFSNYPVFLSWLIFLPAVVALVVALLPLRGDTIKWISLAATAVVFLMSLAMIFGWSDTQFQAGVEEMQNLFAFKWIPSFGIQYLMGTDGIDIPPNSLKATQGFFALRRAARVESFQPHMHLRGKAMSMEAILPNGQGQMLSHVNDFNFNWHNSYVYTDDAAPLLPKGTIIKITAWHDNTSAKSSNPNPNTWVGGGGRTVDEMAHAWVDVTYLDQAEFDRLVAARKAKAAMQDPDRR